MKRSPDAPVRLVLGDGLRPIVFGGSAETPNLFATAAPGRPPELLLSVHARDDDLLGYLVIDRGVPNATWGAFAIGPDASLASAIAGARSTATQIELSGSLVEAHRCALVAERAAREQEAGPRSGVSGRDQADRPAGHVPDRLHRPRRPAHAAARLGRARRLASRRARSARSRCWAGRADGDPRRRRLRASCGASSRGGQPSTGCARCRQSAASPPAWTCSSSPPQRPR